MKKNTIFSTVLFLLFCLTPLALSSQTLSSDNTRTEIFAPFVSRFKAETRGSAILLSWKDTDNLVNPDYRIYSSLKPLTKETLRNATLLGTVPAATEQFLYEPGDGLKRYFIVLPEKDGQLFEVFIPYRNMNMTPVSAVLYEVEEERATYLSRLKVIPEMQEMHISGYSTAPERPVIIFRSTSLPRSRDDLIQAARVTTITGEKILWKDQVVPGIPFYYAMVDKDLFEAGSPEILYEGSVTTEPVMIPMEEWFPEEAHTFQYFSRHIPLPILNITSDIEKGMPLPGPALTDSPTELSGDTALQLAELNFGKSVRSINWMEEHVLPVDTELSVNPAIEGIPLLLENRDWEAVVNRTTRELENLYDKELTARLHYYRGQARYFQNEMEYAFMDFLSSRELYYAESNKWLYNIFEIRESRTRKERVEF